MSARDSYNAHERTITTNKMSARIVTMRSVSFLYAHPSLSTSSTNAPVSMQSQSNDASMSTPM